MRYVPTNNPHFFFTLSITYYLLPATYYLLPISVLSSTLQS